MRPLPDWHILHSSRLSLARLPRRNRRRTWRPPVQPRGPWKIAATFPRVTTRSLQHTRRTCINRQQVSASLARGLTDFIVYSVTHTLAHDYILVIASLYTCVGALVRCPIYCNDGNWWFRHELPAACKNEGGGVSVDATSIGPKTVGWPQVVLVFEQQSRIINPSAKRLFTYLAISHSLSLFHFLSPSFSWYILCRWHLSLPPSPIYSCFPAQLSHTLYRVGGCGAWWRQ